MVGAGVHLELAEHLAPEGTPGQHALDRPAHHFFGLGGKEVADVVAAGAPAVARDRAPRIDVISPARRRPRPISTIVPTTERTICWQNDDASISNCRTPPPTSCHPRSSTRRTLPPPACDRQKEVKSCSPMSASPAACIARTSSGALTCHDVAARNGSGTARLSMPYR